MDGSAEDASENEARAIEATAAKETLRFIRDEPADIDFFQTHTALAKAIAQTIVTNPLLRTIGLLGRWGSGKSTVLRQLERELETAAPHKFHIFTYDAWLHQHDPVRRSFIEELTAFAADRDCGQSSELNEEIKQLLGQVRTSSEEITPTLTADAKALLVSLLPVPIGLALLRLDVIKGAFGSDTSRAAILTFWLAMAAIAAPIMTWIIRYLYRRPWKKLPVYLWPPSRQKFQTWRASAAKFFRITDPDGRPSAIIPTLINQSIKRTSIRTVTLPEPTTIEFGRVFRCIIEGLNKTGKRLTIVIDNLDRVPEEEALQIWATIRSFFSASFVGGETAGPDPLVLLPIDRTAVQRMFARSHGKDNADELAESFVHKTFEVTFEVTQAVMSDWRDYLAQQMSFAFGSSLGENWTFWTRKFFERKQQEKKLSPTPRQINRLINRLLGSYMQWGSASVSFPLQAYFVIFHDEVEDDFNAFIVSNQPELAKIALRWQEQIAALHFGVEVAKAIQTLLDGPVRIAIQTGALKEVEEYRDVPGFDDSLELISSDLGFAETGQSPDFNVVRNAVGLMDNLQRPANEATVQTWRNIASYYCALQSVDLFGATSAKTIATLSAHVPSELTERFIELSADAVAEGLRSETPDGQREVREAGSALLAFCQPLDQEPPYFYLGKTGQLVILRVAQVSAVPGLLPRCYSDILPSELDQSFAQDIRDPLEALIAATAFSAIMANVDEELFTEIGAVRRANWSETLAACSEGIRYSLGSQSRAATDVLFAAMPYNDGAKDIVRQASQDGTLGIRLPEAIDAAEPDQIAKYCAALIWAEVDFGTSTPWTEILKRHSDLPRLITEYLRKIQGPKTLAVIWKAYETSKTARDLVRGLIEHGILQNDLGPLNPQGVMSHLAYYLRPIPYWYIDRFISRISNYGSFWEKLPEVELTDNFQKAAKALGKDKNNRARIEAIVKPKIDSLTATQWAEIVRTGAEPYPVIEEVFPGKSLGFGKGSPLFHGLEDSVPQLFSSDRAVKARWSALRLHLKDATRKSLGNAVAHVILQGQTAAETLAVFKLLGDDLLRSSVWTKNADTALREVVIRQSAAKPGRAWLKLNGTRVKAWIARSTPETRTALREALSKMQARGGDEKRYWAEVCLSDWKP